MDRTIFFIINHGWANPVLDGFFLWVSTWWGFGLPLGLLMLFAFRRKWGKQGMILWWLLVLAVLCGETGGRILKIVASQPRPCYEMAAEVRQPGVHKPGPCGNGRDGMPSNHALDYFAAATLVTATFRSRKWAFAFFGIAFLAALSRIYLGKHYPSQMMAGASIGVVWGFTVARFARKKLQLADGRGEPEESLSLQPRIPSL